MMDDVLWMTSSFFDEIVDRSSLMMLVFLFLKMAMHYGAKTVECPGEIVDSRINQWINNGHSYQLETPC